MNPSTKLMTARSGFANTERVRFRSSDEAGLPVFFGAVRQKV
jgi:hypothetical protein